MIEASYATTSLVFKNLVKEVADWRVKNKMSYRALSRLSGVDTTTCRFVLNCQTRSGNHSPMQSHRVTTILRLRNTLNLETIIQTRAGKEQFNLSLPEEQERLKAKVLKWAKASVFSSGELDRIAGLAPGQTSGVKRWPERYLSLRLAIQAHTKWIEPMEFVTRYDPEV